MNIRFSIYLATQRRWAFLQKDVSMEAVPRVGEWVKFRNKQMGDYFGYRVSQVTHREGGIIEIQTDVLNDDDGRMYSFDDETELDDYVASYLLEGWTCPHGVKPNTRFRKNAEDPA